MKKPLIMILIGLFLSVLFISGWYKALNTPDKVLEVGHSIDGKDIQFRKEIKDQEKIALYERILTEVEFTETVWEPEGYPDYLLKVHSIEEGIGTAFTYLWFDGDKGILYIPSVPDENFAEITIPQAERLKEIIE